MNEPIGFEAFAGGARQVLGKAPPPHEPTRPLSHELARRAGHSSISGWCLDAIAAPMVCA